MIDPEITAIEARAASAAIDISEILKEAGVAQSTWSRWKNENFDPRRATLRKLQAALASRLGEKAA